MKPATVVGFVVTIVVVPHSRWISDKTNRDQVRPPTRLLHLPIIIVSAALRTRSSVIAVLPWLVEVLAKVVVGRKMVLRQQWLNIVVIIWLKISESLRKLIERSLVARKEVLLVVDVVRKRRHGLLLPLSVPHVRIEVPMIVEIHINFIYSSLPIRRILAVGILIRFGFECCSSQ